MFVTIRDACLELIEQFSDFWLLAALSDWSYEEGIRGGRNKGFGKAVDSHERAGVPSRIIQQLRAGINGTLAAILRARGIEVQCRPDCGPDLELSQTTALPARALVEVKLIFDGTFRKYYANVAADRKRLLSWKSPETECVQVVFFTQLPCFHYPAGRWYGANKLDPTRQTPCLGIENQFQQLMAAMPHEPTWPETSVHVHRLEFPTAAVTEDLLLHRYEEIFTPAHPWKFVAADQLNDAQVGVALWRVE